MTPPIHSPADRAALKTAFRLLVLEVGGLRAAASVTRVGMSALADYYHPQKPDCFPPVDVVMDLEAVANLRLVTAELARVGLHRLLPLPEAVQGEPAEACARAFQESAEGAVALFQALSDGALTDLECAGMDRHLSDIEHAAGAARAVMARRRRPGGGSIAPVAPAAGTGSPGAAAPCGGGQPGARCPLRGDGAGRLPS